jgi:hypothetical protein
MTDGDCSGSRRGEDGAAVPLMECRRSEAVLREAAKASLKTARGRTLSPLGFHLLLLCPQLQARFPPSPLAVQLLLPFYLFVFCHDPSLYLVASIHRFPSRVDDVCRIHRGSRPGQIDLRAMPDGPAPGRLVAQERNGNRIAQKPGNGKTHPESGDKYLSVITS